MITPGDEHDFIGPCAQFIDNVGNEIVELAVLPHEFGQRCHTDVIDETAIHVESMCYKNN